MLTEPLLGWRCVGGHRAADAHRLGRSQNLVDDYYPEASEDRAGDGQPQHAQAASLYEAFPPDEARRIAERLEIHYTPKHGSWLNIAEIELRVLTVQCLTAGSRTRRPFGVRFGRGRPPKPSDDRVDWQFTADDARIHLKQLYPRFKA